jgi:hypothetical protein
VGSLGRIDGQQGRGAAQERRHVADGAAVGAIPSEPCVLHDVFGAGFAADDPLGYAQQSTTDAEKVREMFGTRRCVASRARRPAACNSTTRLAAVVLLCRCCTERGTGKFENVLRHRCLLVNNFDVHDAKRAQFSRSFKEVLTEVRFQ